MTEPDTRLSQSTILPIFRTFLIFGTMFGRFTHNPQSDAMGTGTKQGRKSYSTSGRYDYGTSGKHGYVISFVFWLTED